MSCIKTLLRIIQIILGLSCVAINVQCFIELRSISTGYELIFHITVVTFLMGTIIFEFSAEKSDRRTFDAIAAIGLLGASCCLIKFINDGYSLNDGLGERSIMEKAITKIGDIVDEAMDPKIMDEVFNKYKRSNVYQKYMISGVIGLLNGLMYVSTACFASTNVNGQAFAMHERLPRDRIV